MHGDEPDLDADAAALLDSLETAPGRDWESIEDSGPDADSEIARRRWAGRTALLDPLVERLATGDEQTRRRAARALGWVGDAAAVDPLVGRLRADDSEAVREAAAVALGDVGDDAAVEALLDAFRGERFRPRVVESLAACGGVEETLDIAETYDGPDRAAVREAAVRGLAALDDDRGTEAVVEFLLAGDPVERRAAASALSPEDDRARDALVTALSDDAPAVRSLAVESLANHVRRSAEDRSLVGAALHRFGFSLPSSPPDPVLDALLDVAAPPDPDPDSTVRRRAVEALADAPPSERVDRALERTAAEDDDAAVRTAAGAALEHRE